MSGQEHTVASESVLSAASASKATACDCEFVTLAKKNSAFLLSPPIELFSKFPDAEVDLRDFVGIR
jgi:hypothetical protein